jgi:hexosaminidase
MDPTRESTYRFLDGFIGEVSRLFPDKYWHVGGDEVDPRQWKGSAAIQAYMKRHGIAGEVALHTAFNKRLFAIVQKHGKIPVGWDEIFQPDLPTSAVIQSWRSSTALAASARAGFGGILSAPYYIDHMKPASDFYLADPIPGNTDLTPEQQALVLGGEACMWSEYVVTETLASRIWPRLASIAERFCIAASMLPRAASVSWGCGTKSTLPARSAALVAIRPSCSRHCSTISGPRISAGADGPSRCLIPG